MTTREMPSGRCDRGASGVSARNESGRDGACTALDVADAVDAL